MDAFLTTPVHLITPVPGGADVRATLGTLRVAVVDGRVDQEQLREQLAAMLTEAGEHLARHGVLADLAPSSATTAGVGESGSPA
ncbi:hypothetical protein [Streptomyces uncialis]|uniref:hypothetical protein n=1 Tax=Streptomyces uncialis TaxID=1048205 RepID=UPI002254ABDA|nr:hypothetical protein [Streptomyces uncialis]MCX4661489.1 hypothetical protein [Streptomyces uncialis]